MSRLTVEMAFDLDDEALAAHDGAKEAPPNDVEDWDGYDIFRARDFGFLQEPELLDRVIERDPADV